MYQLRYTQENQVKSYLKSYPDATVYHKDAFCTVYFYTNKHGSPAAFAFQGKAAQPVYHEVYRDSRLIVGAHSQKPTMTIIPATTCRQERADSYIKSLTEYKANVNANRGGVCAADYVKVGDIFHYSWGYDQTNCEFYQVTEVKAKTVVIREIGSEAVKNSGGFMCCSLIALKDKFLKPIEGDNKRGYPMTKLVKVYQGKPSLSMEFGSAHLWDGKPCYSSWYA